jgi:hypothetical protein
MPNIPYQYLPLPAKCAIEYLDCQSERSIAQLDLYLDHYFKFYGLKVEDHVRTACHQIAVRRFSLADPFAQVDAAVAHPLPSPDKVVVRVRVTPKPRHMLDPISEVWVYAADQVPHLLMAMDPQSDLPCPWEVIGKTFEEAHRYLLRHQPPSPATA